MGIKKTKPNSLAEQIKLTVESAGIIFRTCPKLSIIFILMEIGISLLPFVVLITTSELVNAIPKIADGKINTVAFPLIFFVSANILVELISPIRELMRQTMHDKVVYVSQANLFEAVNRYKDMNIFEDPTYFNRLQEAREGSGSKIISSIDLLSSLFRGIVTIITSSVIFLRINWWIGLISVLSLIPKSYYGIWSARNRVALFRSRSEAARRLSYYDSLITEPSAAKEVRLFRLGEYLLDIYKNLFSTEQDKIMKLRIKHGVVGVICLGISAFVSSTAVLLFCYQAIKNRMDVGEIVLYIGLIPRFINGLTATINAVIYTADNNYYIKMYSEFIKSSKNIQSSIEEHKELKFRHITFDNVSFSYPGTDRYALKSISFDIKSPGLIAVVGKNGSGKSTMAKLLLRMFEPTKGEYYVDGENSKHINIDNFRTQQSGVFQDFAQLNFTVAENVWFGNIDTIMDLDHIIEVSKTTDIHNVVNELKDDYNSMLGKQFSNGAELSKGQWQKLVWARALYSDAPFLIMDEPTSAIDPESEYTLCQSLHQISKQRLVFYISHRLSSVVLADWILVLDGGILVEQGKHHDLMKKEGGVYYDLFSKQASGYKGAL